MTTESIEIRPQTRIETYIPLYRKYRPQLFADLVGQEAISQTLGNAINLNKVAHAYLFCGPRGTGKTSTARIFAKSLNCENGPTVSPCLQCASCTGIAQGNALDVIEFDAASNNGVGDARELIENCQYSSMTGRFKVYIIDEVHMLTSQAFNALLKTLEEPPANVIFIFATTEAHKVLPTIISRCQRFDFNRITTGDIVNRLRYIADQEAIAIDEEALLMIGRHARGGLRDAVGLLDQVSVLSRAQADKIIGRKDVALFIGNLEEDLLLRLGSSIAERRAADLLSELNELLNRGIEPIQLLKDLTIHFRNLLLVQVAGGNANPDLLSLPPDYFRQLVEQAALFPELEEVPQIIGRLSFVERNVRNSSQPQLWLEVGLIELAYRHEIQLVKDLSDRVTKLEAQLAGGAPIPLVQPKAPPQKPAPPMLQSVAAPSQANHFPVTPVEAPALPPTAATQPPVSKPALAPVIESQPVVSTPAATMPPKPAIIPPAMPQPISEVVQAMPLAPAAHTQAPLPAASGSLDSIYAQMCAAIPGIPFRSMVQQQTFPISQEGDSLIVGCLENYLEKVKNPDKMAHLQRAVDKAFGRPMRIEVTLEKNRPAGQPTPAPIAPAISAQPAVGSNPMPDTLPSIAATPLEPIVAEKTPLSFTPALPETPEPSKAKPESPVAQSPSFDDGPPDIDNPPPTLDEDESYLNSLADGGPAPVAVSFAGDPELNEAKKHAVELLQGRILE